MVTVGSGAAFTVSAAGPPPLAYQWYFNGAPLAGQTNTLLDLTNLDLAQTGGYDVVVSNPNGVATSAVARLVVGSPPAFVTKLSSQSVPTGGSTGFTVAMSGAGPFAYQWQFAGMNLANPVTMTENETASIITVAGAGLAGYSGDGGLGVNAELNGPTGLAVDRLGNVFISDSGNHLVRRVGTNGVITTVAGNGTEGYAGDGGPATNAEMDRPADVALDGAGNLLIVDAFNHRIRKVDTNGIISTVAGNGTQGFSGDGGPAANAQLNDPGSIAFDHLGNYFIGDSDNNRVRKVDTNGIITTVAGNGTDLFLGDGGPATNAEFYGPTFIAFDGAGNLFIADTGNDLVRRIGTNGLIATVAGGGTSGDGSLATTAWLDLPVGLAVDGSGNLFISDSEDQRVREVVHYVYGPSLVISNAVAANAGNYDVVVASPFGSVTSSVATLTVLLPPGIEQPLPGQAAPLGGSAIFSVSATGTAPLIYQWYSDGTALPGQTSIALDLKNLALADAGDYAVVVTNLYGAATSAVAVLAVGVAPGISAQPPSQTTTLGGNTTLGVGISGTGPFDFQWQFNGTNLPAIITTVAGGGQLLVLPAGGVAATNTELGPSGGVALDGLGNLFVTANEGILRVDTNGTATALAGSVQPGYSGDGGAAANAKFSGPAGVAVDSFGNVFVADSGNCRIRKIDTNGIITTVAGGGNQSPGDGGAATNPPVGRPSGVAVDGFGNLFIADSLNSRVRKVGTDGTITTLAGNGVNGYSGDGGAATNAALNVPEGLTVDGFGNVFVADTRNNRIRKIDTHGIITTVAGKGPTNGSLPNYSGDGGAATNAGIFGPNGVAVDGLGNLFMDDKGNQRIRKVGDYALSLVLDDVTAANAGNYDVVVTSPFGSVTSSVVTLTVAAPLSLRINGGGGNVTMLQVTGAPGQTYVLESASSLVAPVVWQPVYTNVADASGARSFTNAVSTAQPALFYRLVVP